MNLNDCLELYAIPGAQSIIDMIHPVTGLTIAFHRTEAEVIALNPGAERMTWEKWQEAAIVRQQTPILWEPTTAEHYDEMLNILPPAAWIGGAFLVGEPEDHCFATGRPRFRGYWQKASGYYVSSRPLTIVELRKELQQP